MDSYHFSWYLVKVQNSLQYLMTFPPAFTPSDTNNVLTDNRIALHKAREAFISSEDSEKIIRALSNNIRTTGDAKFITRDKVYYKRANDRRWKGLASVLGQDGQQVLVKHYLVVIIYVYIPVD